MSQTLIRQILEHADNPLTAGELMDKTALSSGTVYKHLNTLYRNYEVYKFLPYRGQYSCGAQIKYGVPKHVNHEIMRIQARRLFIFYEDCEL